MKTPLDNIKPHVRAIKAYTLAPLEAPIKINQNENPFGMPAAIKDEVLPGFFRRTFLRLRHRDGTRIAKQVAVLIKEPHDERGILLALQQPRHRAF